MPQGRLGSKKVKTGCTTCKIRNVKCDEEKPACRRCTSTGRKCDGYRPTPVDPSVQDWLPDQQLQHLTSPSPERVLVDFIASTKERRSISFYRDQVAPALSNSLDSSFWNGLVLQVAHMESAVRYAVMAIGDLFERTRSAPIILPYLGNLASKEEHRFAIHCYNKAIVATQEHLNSTTLASDIPLLTCILFVCIEFLQGNVTEASSLSNRGRIMLSSMTTTTVKKHCKPIFDRLKIHSALVGRPQEDALASSSSTVSSREPNIEFSIKNIQEARMVLYTLMDQGHEILRSAILLKFGQTSSPSSNLKALQTKREGLLYSLRRWLSQVSEQEGEYDAESAEKRACSVLHMYYSSTFTLSSVALEGSETAYDCFLAEFQSIVHRATALLATGSHANPGSSRVSPFTFELGLIPPLYFTAIKCREPKLRREAVSLLSHTPQREGLWDALEMAAVAKQIIRMEEKDLAHQDMVNDQSHYWPEESCRIHDALLGKRRIVNGVNGQEQRIAIDVEFQSRTKTGDWHVEQSVVVVESA